MSLISPSTGAINFALQAHTNLIPAAITASSASAGQFLGNSGGITVWTTPSVNSSSVVIVAGSTGQVFAVTSSNSAPAFQVLPIDGGLSTTVPTAGMTYAISTSAGVLKGLAIGTSGQVYTVSTSGMPAWVTPSASGATFDPESNVVFYEDFYTSGGALTSPFKASYSWVIDAAAASGMTSSESRYGVVEVFGNQASISHADTGPFPIGPFRTADKFTMKARFHSTSGVPQRVGVGIERADAGMQSGIWFNTSNPTTPLNVFGFVVNGAGSTSLDLGVTATAFHKYAAVVTGSSTVQFYVDAALVGTINSSHVPSGIPLNPSMGSTANSASMKIDYYYITSTR